MLRTFSGIARCCHCEERSDEAIPSKGASPEGDCFASLAMTSLIEAEVAQCRRSSTPPICAGNSPIQGLVMQLAGMRRRTEIVIRRDAEPLDIGFELRQQPALCCKT